MCASAQVEKVVEVEKVVYVEKIVEVPFEKVVETVVETVVPVAAEAGVRGPPMSQCVGSKRTVAQAPWPRVCAVAKWLMLLPLCPPVAM